MTMLRMIDKLINAEDYSSVRKTVSKEFVDSIKDSLASDYKELSERELVYQESLKQEKKLDHSIKYNWPEKGIEIVITEDPVVIVFNGVGFNFKQYDELLELLQKVKFLAKLKELENYKEESIKS